MQVRIIFYLLLSFLLFSACNQTDPKTDNLIKVALSAQSLLQEEASSSRSQGNISVSLQDTQGKTLTFDQDHKASSSGNLQYFTLESQSDSVILYVLPGRYFLNINNQENLPYKQMASISTDGQTITLAPKGKYSEDRNVAAPDPEVSDSISSLNLVVFGRVASVDRDERQVTFEGLNNINFAVSDDTFYLDHEQGEVDTITFLEKLTAGDLLFLDGFFNGDSITAFFIEKLTDIDPFLETGYLVVSGEISQLDEAAPSFALKNLENLNLDFSNASYGNEFEAFEATKFWQRAENGRAVMLEGTFKEQTLTIGHAFLPAKTEEIPPLPDGEEIGLEGEIIELKAEVKELRLRSGWSRLEEVTVKTSTSTLYYGGRGEITEQDFWSRVALGGFIFVEGFYVGGVLEAKTIFLNEIVEPIIWLEGKVKSFNKTTQTLTIDSSGQFTGNPEPPIRKLEQLASSSEEPISSPGQPEIIPEQFEVSTTENTSYIDEQGLKITPQIFWEKLQVGDYLAIEGEFADNGNVLALAIYKYSEPKLWFEGKVKSFDVTAQTLIIDSAGQFIGGPERPASSTSSSSDILPNPEQLNVSTTKDTKYVSEYGLDLTPKEFWEKLQIGDYLAIEGEFTDDGSVLALAIYKHPKPKLWFEGKVKSFDVTAQTLIIDSTGQFIGGLERPASSTSPSSDILPNPEQLNVSTTKDTKYVSEYGLDLTPKEFWEKLQIGDYLSIEGEFTDDGNILALAIYKHPEPKLWFEGKVKSFDVTAQTLIIDSTGQFIGGLERPASSTSPSPDILPNPEQLNVSTTKDTKYVSEYGLDLTPKEFWEKLQIGDYLSIEGEFIDDDSVLALAIYKYSEPKTN